MLGVATSMTIAFPALQYFHSGEGGGGTPYNGLYGETPTAKGVPFQASLVTRISLVTVYGNVGKSVISVCKEA